jgi:two-component system chemotaxis sensor kinase CheA
MNDGIEQGRDAFREEAAELLAELETSLLELEEDPKDGELIGRVFRAMHTIKGSGAMFGFDDIAAFTHEVETAFDMVRNGKLAVSRVMIDLTLASRDQIRTMLSASLGLADVDQSESERIMDGFRRLIAGEGGAQTASESGPAQAAKAAQAASAGAQEKETEDVTYRVRFRPVADIFASGTNPLLLVNELRGMGRCQVTAQIDDIPTLDNFDPETCRTYWDIILTTRENPNAIKDVFIFVEDACELNIEMIDEAGAPEDAGDYKKLGEILVEKGDVRQQELKTVLSAQKKVGQILVEAGVVDAGHVESALAEQQRVKEVREERQKTEAVRSIRVTSEKLDSLVDLVGELVTVQARLSQTSVKTNDSSLVMIAEEVERLTWELRDSTMSIRMLPIGSTFSKFKRLVRDLSNDLGKEVALTTEGEDTELDKTVIERLNDPLVHIIRNSIDHGIEMPDERQAAGKKREGTVHLSATHSGASVLIKITDDGKGLDQEAIVEKAIVNGLVAPDAVLTEKEIFALIFEPGFSTAKKITGVSGRGVGMDVVKRNIDALRGTVEVKSEKGRGSTITLKLPLTLAIIDGLLVKVGGEFFVIPLSVVEGCVELKEEDIQKAHGRHTAVVRGELVPYVKLREYFDMQGETLDIEQIVITDVEDARVGFVVDYVIGEHQTVIKTLGKVYKDAEGVSGATILGDGTVALILDIPRLIRLAERKESGAGRMV